MFASWPFFGDFFRRRWLESADPEVLAEDALSGRPAVGRERT